MRSILPTSTSSSSSSSGSFAYGHHASLSTGGLFLAYIRRLVSPSQMDWEYTARQMVLLVSAPAKVYELSKYRKSTRDQWARDDPAFLVLLFAFVLASAVAYGIAFEMRSLGEFALLFFYAFLLVFVLGAAVATVMSTIANRRMRITDDAHAVAQHVEWLYAFDIHANALFPAWLILAVLQYLLLPVLLHTSYVACVLSNALHVGGFLVYVYITHLGYRSMPFLERTQVFLMPALPVIMVCLLLTMLDMNLSRAMVWVVCG
jgi:hypothetical protein